MKKLLLLFGLILIVATTFMPSCNLFSRKLPVIDSFYADPPSILAGESSMLSWKVSGATTVSIDQGIGPVSVTGTRAVAPSETTTYTLTATNVAGSVIVTTQVMVSAISPPAPIPPAPAPTKPTDVPVVNYFFANPNTITAGNSITLSWSVSGATSVTIDQGIGTFASSGSTTVFPASSTTYILTATNSAGSTVATTQVIVESGSYTPPPTPPAFAVVGVTASVDPSDFSGPCPKNFSCSAVITVNGPGTVTYRWERSDGGSSPTQTVTFGAAGSQTVTTGWPRASAGNYWVRVRILTPNELISNQASFNLMCSPSPIIQVIKVELDPPSPLPIGPVPCPFNPSFKVTITTNGPCTVTYRWERSDGNSPQQTMVFTAAGSKSATTGWPQTTSGHYWVQVRTLTPNELLSPKREWNITCQ